MSSTEYDHIGLSANVNPLTDDFVMVQLHDRRCDEYITTSIAAAGTSNDDVRAAAEHDVVNGVFTSELLEYVNVPELDPSSQSKFV